MTSQYPTPSINAPRIVRIENSDADIVNDDEFVVFDTTTGAVNANLPDATTVPGTTLSIKATNAGSTGNPVTVNPFPGQNIDGAASVTLSTDQVFLVVKSDGSNFRIVSQFSGGGSFADVSVRYDTVDGPSAPLIPGPDAANLANVALQGAGNYSVRLAGYNLTGGAMIVAPAPSGRTPATNWTLTVGATTVTPAVEPEPDIADATATVVEDAPGPTGDYSFGFQDADGSIHWLGVWSWGGSRPGG